MNRPMKLLRYIRMTKLKWIIAVLFMLSILSLMNEDTCKVYPHPLHYGNNISASTSSMFSDVLELVGYRKLSASDVEKFVTSRGKVEHFDFNLNSNVCFGEEVYILGVVPSKPSNVMERKTIRETWGTRFNKFTKLRLVFLTGLADEVTNHKLSEERNVHLDIIQASFLDSYKNLTLKTVAMLQWTNQFCPHAKYLAKIDDDVFLHTDNLLSKLSSLKNERRFILGRFRMYSFPIRDKSSKWYSSLQDYPYQRFPPYSGGPAYVISTDLVEDLYSVARHSSFHMEDVFVTGLCAYLVGADHVGSCGFDRTRDSLVRGGRNDVVTVHEVTPEVMREVWKTLNSWTPTFKLTSVF